MAVAVAPYIIAVVLAYFLGSIPTGYLVARARGVDIRTVGSGNIGATNVFRILGKPAGAFVLLTDAAKGFTAVCLVGRVLIPRFLRIESPETIEWLMICAGISAVLGHNYTCWL